MTRKYLLAGLVLLLVVGTLAGIKISQIRGMIQAGASFTMPPETIGSAQVREVQWETAESAIGSVTAVQGVLLRTEVPGMVKRIAFESGATVRAGQMLVELDHSWEQARLASADAAAELARANLTRARDLHAQQILPKSDLDAAEATFTQTVGAAEAIRVEISKKILRAPFDGRLGIRQIQLGAFADVGTPVVPISSLGPVHVDFTLPEQSASSVKRGMKVRVTSDAAPGRSFEGILTAVSPEVDALSRNIKLQATLPDTEELLLPGMFAQVELVRDESISPLVIPLTSVLRAPYGDSVFVISDVTDEKTGKTSKRVRMTTVKLGETRGDLVVVEHGLEVSQEIATSGVFKLSNGTEVVVNNDLAQPVDGNPNPTES